MAPKVTLLRFLSTIAMDVHEEHAQPKTHWFMKLNV
jgi:hypothetical protein